MKRSYIAPQTEILPLIINCIMGDNDSGGDVTPSGPDIGANSFSFDEGAEDSSTKGIWED